MLRASIPAFTRTSQISSCKMRKIISTATATRSLRSQDTMRAAARKIATAVMRTSMRKTKKNSRGSWRKNEEERRTNLESSRSRSKEGELKQNSEKSKRDREKKCKGSRRKECKAATKRRRGGHEGIGTTQELRKKVSITAK